MPGPKGWTAAAFALLTAIAGLNFVAVSYSNDELAPFWGAALRFGLAGGLLAAFVAASRRRFPRGRALAGALVYGVLGFGIFYGLVYFALVDVGPGMASVLLALVPLVTFFVALVHRTEAFRWQGLAGGAIAVAGTAVVFWDQLRADAPVAALVAILLASVATAEAAVTIKRFPRGDPYATNAVAMASGAALLLLFSFFAHETRNLPQTAQVWTAFVYLVLPGSVLLFGLFLFVIARWTASATSYLFVLAPLVAIAASAVLRGEEFRWEFGLGAALVVWGVYEGALRHHRVPAHAHPLAPSGPREDPGGVARDVTDTAPRHVVGAPPRDAAGEAPGPARRDPP